MTSINSTNSVFSSLGPHGLTIPKNLLLDSSIAEFAAIVELGEYKGVKIDALDMSSGAKTGTFKDWVACTTIAYCKYNNIESFVTQSSGNTANAIAAYCTEFEQHVTIFFMLGNSKKIKPQFFPKNKFLNLIAVDGSEARMKELTTEYAANNQIPWLPRLDIQDLGNSVRADYILDYCQRSNKRYDWHSQSLSSGYGVFGFYLGLERLKHTKGFKFLGVQQTAVSPFIQRFKPAEFVGIDMNSETLIEKTLFRSSPTEELYTRMKNILTQYGGSFSLVSNSIFEEYFEVANKLLVNRGLNLEKDEHGNIVEKSGLLDLIGVLKSVDNETISKGERILISITGGFGAAPIGNLASSKIMS